MGQHLSEPETTKESASSQNDFIMIGSSGMKGWRSSMESFGTHLLSLPEDNNMAFFSIYDGHGGDTVAQLVRSNLPRIITNRHEYKCGDFCAAIREGFLQLDYMMKTDKDVKAENVGCTAVAVLIKGNQLFCGNIGRSHAVACINGTYKELSVAHNPNNPLESARILSAGGWIGGNFINGVLSVSRTFGDFEYKRNESKSVIDQIVIPFPDVQQHMITKDWEFVVLASHGIWDANNISDIMKFIRDRLGGGMNPQNVCEEVLTASLATECPTHGRGSVNNMMVELICFLQGEPWEIYCSNICATPKAYIEQYNANQNTGF